MLFRFLIILGLIAYVIYKIGSFFFRAGAASQELKNYRQRDQTSTKASKPQKGKIKGGDYVDYEEVK
ncbi:MAG TPA: hypothetical protein VGK59_06835 [Ohtaekwangia sp.]